MSSADGKAEAFDASVESEPNTEDDRALGKLRAAVDYHEREVEVAAKAETNAKAKAARVREQTKASLAEAKQETTAAKQRLKDAKEALAEVDN